MKRSVLVLLAIVITASILSAQSRTRRTPALKNDKTTQQRGGATTTSDVPPPTPAEMAAQKKADDEIVKVETNLVTTPVSVLDRAGRFIATLKKKDFRIFEDGKLQEITYFQSSEQPFTVVLMIDTSPSTRYHIDEIHYAAVTFVNQLRPADRVMVVAFDQRLKILTEPTTEKQKLFAAIYKSQFGSGTSLYDAVDYITELDLENMPGRKAVVMFTDGVDTTSRRANYESTIAGVEEVDALFYPIRYDTQKRGDATSSVAQAYGVQLPPGLMVQLGRGQSPAEYELGKSYLTALATNSGGRIFEADTITNLESAFSGVAEELRRQYSIGYYASDPGTPGDRKRIKIEVVRPPRAVIRSKTTYVVKQPDEPTAEEGGSSTRLQSE